MLRLAPWPAGSTVCCNTRIFSESSRRPCSLAKTRRVYSFFIFCFHLFSKQPFRSSRYLSTFSRSIESDRCKPFDAETSVSFEIHHKSRGYVDDTWKMLYVYMFEKIFRVFHTIPAARLSCPSCPFRPTSQPLRSSNGFGGLPYEFVITLPYPGRSAAVVFYAVSARNGGDRLWPDNWTAVTKDGKLSVGFVVLLQG